MSLGGTFNINKNIRFQGNVNNLSLNTPYNFN